VSAVRLQHAKVSLALHPLSAGTGRPLLLLHGLGECSPKQLPAPLSGWSGPVFALDFTGHGESSASGAGGYTAEVLMGDVDTALQHLGPCTIVGRGLGAYIAVLIAGARPTQVRGVLLCDGIGLAGGGPVPGSPRVIFAEPTGIASPDPFALAELSQDVRPPDYATAFIRQANELSGLDRPVSVCCVERPAWLEAVVKEPGVVEASVEEALQRYAARA